MFFVQLTPTRDSASELLDALRQREVAVFGPSTPGQTRTPNEGNGTPKRNIFSGISVYASRISIADRGAAMNRGSWSSRSSSTAAAAQQQQHNSRGGGDVELLFLVPVPRVKPERQMKKMEHRSETFLQDSLHTTSMHCGSALRIVLRDASRIVEQQKQPHSSSCTAAVLMAATPRLRTTRTSVDTPVSFLFSFLRFRAI